MPTHDYTPQLRQLMAQINLSSFAALCRETGLPRSQLQRLRSGQIQSLPVSSLVKLSQVLNIPISRLLEQFMPGEQRPNQHSETTGRSNLKAEYQRLQAQLEQQQQELEQTFQQATLQILEPLLLQWPTAAYAAQKNPQAPAVKILPLLRPLDQLLLSWGIEAIGTVGEETTYDPQYHQPMGGVVDTNTTVRIRYVGYRRGKQLLHRAKVSPVS